MNFKRKLFFSWILMFGLIASVSAQDKIKLIKKKVDPNSVEELAKEETELGDKTYGLSGLALAEALDHYLKAYNYTPKDPLLNYKIGYCYLNTINKVRSIPYLEKAFKLKPNIDRDIHFLLGLAYQLNLEWDKAILEFGKYRIALDEPTLKAMAVEITKHEEECKTGKWLMAHPVSVKIENIGSVVNTRFPEFAPFVTGDESQMYFTARKENTTGRGMDDNDFEYFEDVYVSEKENGKWTAPKNIGLPVNSETHDAVAGISSDGQRLFVYRGDVHGGDLFESKLDGANWTEPLDMGKSINTKHHESSACLSSDQKTLYFVSDRPDLSLGGRDIFLSRLDKDGKWGAPENLGPVINTIYDEDGVFLHADDKTLFFSSQAHETMGGYDIFWSKYDDNLKTWSKPINLGYPINTADDDVFFVLSASGEHGYYASVKNDGFGEKDICMISFLDKPVTDTSRCIIFNKVVLVKGRVRDRLTLQPLEASVEIVDLEQALSLAKLQSNRETGKFLITLPSQKNYGVYVHAPGYLFHSENFEIPVMIEYKEIVLEILLDKIQTGSKIVLNNIFYDFDKATLRNSSRFELNKLIELMNKLPLLKIEIASHTDDKGSNEYNVVLSNARAKSVVDWLTSKGININRLEYKGYGETEPATSNETIVGRQLNRRTEFRILSTDFSVK